MQSQRFVSAAVSLHILLLSANLRAEGPPVVCPGRTAQYTTLNGLKQCSVNVVNGNCFVVYSRLAPRPRPLLHLRRGSHIEVYLVDLSPFEYLKLSAQSLGAPIPNADQLQQAVAQFTTNAGKIVDTTSRSLTEAYVVGVTSNPPTTNYDGNELLQEQKNALSTLNGLQQTETSTLIDILKQLQSAGSAPDTNVCSESAPLSDPWLNFSVWSQVLTAKINAQLSAIDNGSFANQLASVEATEKTLEKKISDYDNQPDTDTTALDANTTLIQNVLKALEDVKSRLVGTQRVLVQIPVTDPVYASPTMPNNQPVLVGQITEDQVAKGFTALDTWQVSFSNVLPARIAPVLSATAPYDPTVQLPYTVSTAPLVFTNLIAINVSFENASWLEYTAGLMVPLRAQHTYNSAAVGGTGSASNTIVDNLVQENKAWTVVPTANVHLRITPNGVLGGQRVAGFITGALGYNPNSSTLEMGAGVTFAWKTLMFSPMMDVGRDNQLTGNFYVGQSLGAGNSPPKPTTVQFWAFKPALMISVRIPLASK